MNAHKTVSYFLSIRFKVLYYKGQCLSVSAIWIKHRAWYIMGLNVCACLLNWVTEASHFLLMKFWCYKIQIKNESHLPSFWIITNIVTLISGLLTSSLDDTLPCQGLYQKSRKSNFENISIALAYIVYTGYSLTYFNIKSTFPIPVFILGFN